MGSRKQRRSSAVQAVKEHDLEAMEKLLNDDDSSDGEEQSNEDVQSGDDSNYGSENEEEGSPDSESSIGEEEMAEESAEEETSSLDNAVATDLGDEKCSFDIRNLTAFDPHQVNAMSLYKSAKKNATTEDKETCTISTAGIENVNEEYLFEKANEGCSQLLQELWNLDVENAVATLPSYSEIKIPRSLPPPAPKEPTRWEKFAQERGILPKSKKSRKVWDEGTQSWQHLTGYNASSSSDPQSWPIMEVKKNDDPFEDPWQRARDEKKDKNDKQAASRMRNLERAGLLEKGTATRTFKAKKAAREAGREGGSKDMQNFSTTPSGIPKDLQNGQQRGKELTKLALLATQRSTASMGKFDQMREGEPERKKAAGIKKRKFESGTGQSAMKNEMKKSMKVLDNVLNGGGKEKERAVRRGEYSTGTTAYDYDYDDAPSAYKKKKGRAAAGKLKKLTKKRAK